MDERGWAEGEATEFGQTSDGQCAGRDEEDSERSSHLVLDGK